MEFLKKQRAYTILENMLDWDSWFDSMKMIANHKRI